MARRKTKDDEARELAYQGGLQKSMSDPDNFQGHTGSTSEAVPRGTRRPGSYRPLLVGLAISGALHLAAILLYPALTWRFEGEELGTLRGPSEEFEATRVVNLADPAEPTTEPPIRNQPEPEPREPDAESPASAPTFPDEAEAEPDGPTAAERLRPRDGDDRIWRPVDPSLTKLTHEERAELRIRGALNAWNDSVSAVADARARALDWTHTDEDGNRWGVSPGQIHLGKFSLPLPFSFGSGGAGNLQETMAEQWKWNDIERGARRQEVRETLKERAKAIRERKDRDRTEPPDTSGGGL